MSIKKYVQQVRKRQSNYRPLIERVQEIVEEAMNLPIDIFRGLEYSKRRNYCSFKR